SSTVVLVGARTQSRSRSTVSGRITAWYLPRLKVSRIKSATPQRKLTISLWFTFPAPLVQLAPAMVPQADSLLCRFPHSMEAYVVRVRQTVEPALVVLQPLTATPLPINSP